MEFSLETSLEHVYDKRTKEIFHEVVSGYMNKNYRSAIVMLYTVVMCDLIYKMQDLKDIYQDKNAEAILKKIFDMQHSEPTSSRWEETLLEEIGKQTQLLSQRELDEIFQLKKLRNLSAHPVLKRNEDLLYIPTKEMTLAYIRNMVESVLVKPSLLSRKVIETFLEDISLNEMIFINPNNNFDLKSFQVFLKVRYFCFMSDSLKEVLFKTLWKFVFRLNNKDCDKNRTVNFYALECLYEESKEILKKCVKKEPKFFSLSTKNSVWIYEFLLEHPELYKFLQKDVQLVIERLKKNNDMSAKILGVFLNENIEKHCEELLDFFNNNFFNKTSFECNVKRHLKLLYNYADSVCKNFRVLDCYIEIFAKAFSYDDAKLKYQIFIIPYLEYMSSEELNHLINAIKNNRQIYECIYILKNLYVIDNRAKKYLGEDYSIRDELENING